MIIDQNSCFSEKIAQIGTEKSIKASIIEPYNKILNNFNEVYLFGAKELGAKFYDFFTQAGIKVLGFIDNNPALQNQDYCGCKVFNINDLTSQKQEATIAIASINYINEISMQLRDLGFSKIIPCPVFYLYDEKTYNPEPSFEGIVKDLAENKQQYLDFYNILEDEKSKKVLETLVNFRLSFDFSLYGKIFDQNQYFGEDFLNFEENGIFIDGGGFDGDSTLNYIQKVKNNYKKILFFEPDAISFEKAKENLKNIKNIDFFNKGLYSKSDVFRFNSSGGLGSNIAESGNTNIEVVSIDELLDEKAAYIKMDIEGAELEALKGAKKQLLKGTQFAISLYHKSGDIRQIPQYIKEINPDYKFYLRHYTNTVFETVLYVVK